MERVKESSFLAESLATISTTSSLCRVRGFTIDLLFALKEGPRRTYELAEISGKPRGYVYKYLKRMRKYGLVMKNGFFWNLTILGSDFISYFERVSKYSIVCRHLGDRRGTEERHLEDTSRAKASLQARFDLWLQNSSLPDTEKEVVELLCKHYEKTGSKFVLIQNEYELAKEINKNPQDIRPALANLRQENIIYLLRAHDFPGYHKLGLKKAFVEGLEKREGGA
jgi:hypothetical protein